MPKSNQERITVEVSQRSHTYSVHIGSGILSSDLILPFIQGKKCAIIADSEIYSLYAKPLQSTLTAMGFSAEIFPIPSGEASKSRSTKELIEDQMFQKGFSRDSCVIALGGGVILDLSGFIAATFCRGVSLILIPTTLLAMADACIGGKNGINTLHGKNLIGTFYFPDLVVIDVDVLQTLPERHFRNGMSEIVKHALIADREFFCLLENQGGMAENLIMTIAKSCDIKKRIVEQDPYEDLGIRSLLNFGHTIGHAIELASLYTILHGEAVAIGMIVESKLSIMYGKLTISQYDRIVQLVRKIHPQLEIPAMTNEMLWQAMSLDKKSERGNPRFVLLDDIGFPNSLLSFPEWHHVIEKLLRD